MMADTVVDVLIPEDLLEAIDEAAKEEDRTRSDFLCEIARRYVSERRWRRIQAEVSQRTSAAGIASEDDIEDLIDSVSA